MRFLDRVLNLFPRSGRGERSKAPKKPETNADTAMLTPERLADAMAIVWPVSFRGPETESPEGRAMLMRYATAILDASGEQEK